MLARLPGLETPERPRHDWRQKRHDAVALGGCAVSVARVNRKNCVREGGVGGGGA